MTGRGLEPSGFQGSAPNNNNNAHESHNGHVHPPTEENTTEDDEAEQEQQQQLEEDGGNINQQETTPGGEVVDINNNKQQLKKQSDEAAHRDGSMQQQQFLAEEASRALSRLQIQSSTTTAITTASNTADSPQQSNAIIVQNGGNNASISANNDHFPDENDNNCHETNSNTQLVCTTTNNNNDIMGHNDQTNEESCGALTVLPPNELSTTTSDAALAANTFTEMISDGVRRQNASQRSALGGECPPGFYVDGSGVVRRSGGGASSGGGSGVGGGGMGGGGMSYPGSAGVGGVGSGNEFVDGNRGNIAANDQHRGGGMTGNDGPGISGIMGMGGMHNMVGGASLPSPGGARDPLEGNAYHDDEEDDEDDDDDDDDDEEDSSEISASDEDGSWIAWFCGLRGNEFFCEVDEDYIQDDFNLTGLNGLVPYYDYALDMVLDVEMPMEDSLTEEQQEIVESAAEMLYGLIHARYIVTNRGMHAMYEKYRSASFGRCPHVFCQGQPVLPVGLSDLPRNYTVNVFCPRCHGLFFPKSTRQANIDGAYFGTTFPHLYLMNHPVSVYFVLFIFRDNFIRDFHADHPLSPFHHFHSQDMIPVRPSQQYVPRVYGFKIHQSSLYFRNHEEDQLAAQNDNRNRRVNRSRQGGGRR